MVLFSVVTLNGFEVAIVIAALNALPFGGHDADVQPVPHFNGGSGFETVKDTQSVSLQLIGDAGAQGQRSFRALHALGHYLKGVIRRRYDGERGRLIIARAYEQNIIVVIKKRGHRFAMAFPDLAVGGKLGEKILQAVFGVGIKWSGLRCALSGEQQQQGECQKDGYGGCMAALFVRKPDSVPKQSYFHSVPLTEHGRP
ncbi:MAG: hypothetical protein BWY83_01127 [bacterium ADurb.Bin478]|nr:MAG: hypothetical protein BWY83_01127 [bacterium ADurb.Bin478]